MYDDEGLFGSGHGAETAASPGTIAGESLVGYAAVISRTKCIK